MQSHYSRSFLNHRHHHHHLLTHIKQLSQSIYFTFLHPTHPRGIPRCIPIFATCSSISRINHITSSIRTCNIVNGVSFLVINNSNTNPTTATATTNYSIIVAYVIATTITTTPIHFQLDPPRDILHLPLHNLPRAIPGRTRLRQRTTCQLIQSFL